MDPHLHAAFAPDTRRTVMDHPAGRLHKLRNRIAHHEPLLRRNPRTRTLSLEVAHLLDGHTDLLAVTGLISTDPRDYLTDACTVRTILNQNPPPTYEDSHTVVHRGAALLNAIVTDEDLDRIRGKS